MTPEKVKEQDLALKAERVVRLGDEMTRLLEDETVRLQARQTGEYAQFVKKKQQLLVDYQSAVKSLLERKENFSLMNSEMRHQLRSTGSKLDNVARRNAEKLSVTAAATHKVLQVIIDTIRRENSAKNPKGYDPSQFHSYRDERAPKANAVLLTEKA